jgi:hypothetical protein
MIWGYCQHSADGAGPASFGQFLTTARKNTEPARSADVRTLHLENKERDGTAGLAREESYVNS